MAKIVTRFAPSPTGYLQAGNCRTAVFAYLYAKSQNGSFILRIEDTDKERSKKEYEEAIHQTLAWLSVVPDAVFIQSENAGRHEELLHSLVAENKAYVSKEEPKEPGGRTEVIRFRNPNKVVTFTDSVRGEISVDTTDLKDFVIAKSFTEPVFHFAVVVDDWDEGVTHVIRGEDHISNTPRQILIQEALGAPTPTYVHLPLVLGSDRSKLSKRKGALPVLEYRDLGYLPGGFLNYVATLGWRAPGSDRELYFSKDELIADFDLSGIQKGGAIFDEEKLRWINKEHLSKLSNEEFIAAVSPFLAEAPELLAGPFRTKAGLADLRERLSSLGEARDMLKAGEFSFYQERPAVTAEKLMWKKDLSKSNTARHLQTVRELCSSVDAAHFTKEGLEAIVIPYAQEEGKGNVLWPMRYALSGRERSPDPFTLAEALGKEETIRRMTDAISILER